MDNAFDELEKRYKNASFDGHGITVHKVPHDSDVFGYDRYPEGAYPAESAMIAKPKNMEEPLRSEYVSLIDHCSKNLYRIEFKRCREQGCTLCANHTERDCPLNRFLNRFPNNQMPMPVPVFPPFPPEVFDTDLYKERSRPADVNAILERCLVPIKPKSGLIGKSAEGIGTVLGHYRTFGDLLQSRLPKYCHTYVSDFYRGTARRLKCSECREPHILRSAAAYQRHFSTLHGDIAAEADESDPDEYVCSSECI